MVQNRFSKIDLEAMDVMRHRVGLTFEAEAENITQEQIVTEIMDSVIVP